MTKIWDVRKEIPEASDEDVALIRSIRPFTMVQSIPRIWAVLQSIKYINEHGVDGDIVECGVWRGGNVLLAGKVQAQFDPAARHLWLYDTFEGMVEPTEHDVFSHGGKHASEIWHQHSKGKKPISEWCKATLEDVQANLSVLDQGLVHYIKGKVEDTLKIDANLPESIAFLRLDTDWYESTKIELEVLYPRLANGGILLIDDYGTWRGSRKAADEYFKDRYQMLHRIDYSGRLLIKTG